MAFFFKLSFSAFQQGAQSGENLAPMVSGAYGFRGGG